MSTREMCNRPLAKYCFIGDFLKGRQHQKDLGTEASDVEVITIALVAKLYFGGRFER